MLKYKTYAENLRMAMQTKDNAQGRPLKIRELADMSGYRYEHVRKLYRGKFSTDQKLSVSRECNDILCDILGLDKDEMWELAQAEKYSQKVGYVPLQLEDPEGRELSEIWQDLDTEQHEVLLHLARTMQAVGTEVSVRR